MTTSKRVHRLKTIQPFFGDVVAGRKNFEVRRNDREFNVDDIVVLDEYDPIREQFTGEYTRARIGYVMPGGQFGIAAGYVVLGLIPVSARPI